eukprot:TRINITY_DN1687_c0_g1_i1.p1 TRINITY_DN1687_c0_g1~~TRINITY_DN1687_c0_g1_i1.p1  ORF type:complete len:463 (-),score=104.79 TRINITY_DN1687_c0_g1_i1:120-1421(-)
MFLPVTRAPLTHLLLATIVLSSLVAHIHGHICFFDPPQRGHFSVGVPGDGPCYRRTDYCGGVPLGNVTATYNAGGTIELFMQQNLNHFYVPKPGFLDVALSYDTVPTNASWVTLDRWDDLAGNDMVRQNNFTRSLLLPLNKTCTHCILRARYVSYNPDEVDPANNTDAIFYQCADIAIAPAPPQEEETKTDDEAEAVPDPVDALKHTTTTTSSNRKDDTHNCCTPTQWSATSLLQLKNPDGKGLVRYVNQTTHYSANSFVRIDRVPLPHLTADGEADAYTNWAEEHLITIANYSNLVEYVAYEASERCENYGQDAFYEWCFGSDRNMNYVSTQVIAGQTYNQYNSIDNIWSFQAVVNADGTCMPSIIGGELSVETFFADTVTTQVDPVVFVPPSYCNTTNGQRRERRARSPTALSSILGAGATSTAQMLSTQT